MMFDSLKLSRVLSLPGTIKEQSQVLLSTKTWFEDNFKPVVSSANYPTLATYNSEEKWKSWRITAVGYSKHSAFKITATNLLCESLYRWRRKFCDCVTLDTRNECRTTCG